MQTVLPHENHVEGFSLTHTQSQETINFDTILPFQNSPDIGGYYDTLFISHWEDDIIEFHVSNSSNKIWHSVNQKRTWYIPNEALASQNIDKMEIRGAILIIIVEGYSDLSFWFHF